jgi:hypothetical protein
MHSSMGHGHSLIQQIHSFDIDSGWGLAMLAMTYWQKHWPSLASQTQYAILGLAFHHRKSWWKMLCPAKTIAIQSDMWLYDNITLKLNGSLKSIHHSLQSGKLTWVVTLQNVCCAEEIFTELSESPGMQPWCHANQPNQVSHVTQRRCGQDIGSRLWPWDSSKDRHKRLADLSPPFGHCEKKWLTETCQVNVVSGKSSI